MEKGLGVTEQPPLVDLQVIRERAIEHQCVCLLVHLSADGERKMEDKCYAPVPDPDSPFCRSCEDAGHPDAHTQAWERIVKRDETGSR